MQCQYGSADSARAARAKLQAKLESLNSQAKAIQGRANAASRDMTPAEEARVDEIVAEFEGVESKIADIDEEILFLDPPPGHPSLRSAGRVVPPMQPVNVAERLAMADPFYAQYLPQIRSTTGIATANPRAYASMFPRAPSDTGGFSCLADFCLTVASGRPDPRLMRPQMSSMSEGVGASGGHLVPSAYVQGILDGALAAEVVRPRANVIAMTTKELDLPAFDYQDGQAAKRAGLALTWSGEGSTLSEQVAATRKISLSAKKATILVRTSSELAEDVQAFDQQLRRAMIAAVASGLDYAFFNASGAGQPLGILNSPCAITVAKESGQASNTLLLQNLSGMFSRLAPGSYGNSEWFVHPTTLPKLLQLAVVVQNVAGTENVGGSTAGAVTTDGAGNLRVFGRPANVTDSVSPLSSAGDVVLADLSQYLVGLRRDAVVEISRDKYFDTDEIGFKLRLRLDGQPAQSTATKLRDGSNTVSPFILLGAR